MSFRTRRWHVPSRNHEPSWGKLRFARSLHQSLSQFGQKYYRGMLVPCHVTMPSFMIFRCVLDLQELKTKFLNHYGRATTPRCLNFIPISCMGPRNSPKDTHVIFWTNFGALEHVLVVQIWIVHIKWPEIQLMYQKRQMNSEYFQNLARYFYLV